MFGKRKKTRPGALLPVTLTGAYRQLLGREPTRVEVARTQSLIERGASVGLLLRELAQSDAYLDRVGTELSRQGPTDPDEYVCFLYEALLGRPADPSGLHHHRDLLDNGETRSGLARRLAGSDEHLRRVISTVYPLPDLTLTDPDRYQTVPKLGSGELVRCYVAEGPDDYRWIEERIDVDGYYDRPGIWGSVVDDDKRRMAGLIAALAPTRTLDLGCANGTVVACLADLGIDAHGIDISSTAIASAVPGAQGRLVLGDVRDLRPAAPYDVVYGLDIFEHVPPSGVSDLIGALRPLLSAGGMVLANIPAFGEDAVFGTVFDIYLEEWQKSADRDEPFQLLHADEMGFPLHGHLTWAHTRWWQAQFEAHNFTRQLEVEQRLQESFGEAFQRFSPARKSFYVFK